jgi:general secretion pathway protein A
MALAAIIQPWKQPLETAARRPDIAAAVPAEARPATPVVVPPEPVPEIAVDVGEDEADKVAVQGEAAELEEAVAGPEPPALASLLLETDSSSYRAAWTELLSLWSVVLPGSVTPDFCDFAKQYGLLCMVEQGNWNTLRQFDRPVILQLAAPDGRRVPVVLQHLEGSVAEVIVGNELYRLGIEQVERSWYGDYILLLQAPPDGRLYMKIGDRGPVVSWLRQQLEQAQGVSIPAPDPLDFDYVLQTQVLAFQRSHGLVADGIVGKNTIIHLNTASGREGVPRLLSGP